MDKNIVRPVGLKGNEVLSRVRELMGENIDKQTKNYVIELTKLGPDSKVYAIVRENHQYFIKVTDKTDNIIGEDFKYIGGLKNKQSEAYHSYANAIKQLNLKFISLNEVYNKNTKIDTFTNDNLVSEDSAFSFGFKTEATTVFEDEESMKEAVEAESEEEIDESEELTGGKSRMKISDAIQDECADVKKKL